MVSMILRRLTSKPSFHKFLNLQTLTIPAIIDATDYFSKKQCSQEKWIHFYPAFIFQVKIEQGSRQ